MAYEGWLSFGGNEVVNNERARGIASSTPCPVHWFKGPRCETLRDALGDAPYTAANLPDAPWYDLSMPDVSGRFFGVFGLSVTGLNSSTRSAAVTEGIDDGAAIGRTRKGSRQVRVRAMLLARGRDALDYGVAWMNAALDPGACGQHGTGCGATDLEYFTDCPPARAMVPDFTPWVETRRNWSRNPDPINETRGWVTTPAVAAITPSPVGIQVDTVVSSATQALLFHSADLPAAPGDRWASSMEVTVPAGYPAAALELRNYAYGPGNTGANVARSGVVTVQPGTTVRIATTPNSSGVVSESATGIRAILYGASTTQNARFYVRRMITERVAEVGDYFDGSSSDSELVNYSWEGEAGFSSSIMAVRSPTDRLQTDEEYAAVVDPYRRFLHGVAVTSGPLERELMNNGDVWGQVFEWTFTAGRPWVYSVTRAVDLPITPTVVIQDIPYNLAPYPSAELAAAGTVVVARNFSPNPSVEVNATGWEAGPGSFITPGEITSGRVSGELSAVGNSSFRTVFTAAAARAGGGEFWAGQEVELGPIAGRRVSFNVWAAELLMAGSPVRLPIEVRVLWLTGDSYLATQVLGTIPNDGGPISVRSIVPPAAATRALVQVTSRMSSWTAGTVLRLYVDALAVTVP